MYNIYKYSLEEEEEEEEEEETLLVNDTTYKSLRNSSFELNC